MSHQGGETSQASTDAYTQEDMQEEQCNAIADATMGHAMMQCGKRCNGKRYIKRSNLLRQHERHSVKHLLRLVLAKASGKQTVEAFCFLQTRLGVLSNPPVPHFCSGKTRVST